MPFLADITLVIVGILITTKNKGFITREDIKPGTIFVMQKQDDCYRNYHLADYDSMLLLFRDNQSTKTRMMWQPLYFSLRSPMCSTTY